MPSLRSRSRTSGITRHPPRPLDPFGSTLTKSLSIGPLERGAHCIVSRLDYFELLTSHNEVADGDLDSAIGSLA